jgi:AcrR family transcriptional regulator
MGAKVSNADRTAATRAALVSAARQLFEEHGYAETSTADIVRAADVTRGALYHHFADKLDLLTAVVIEIQEGLIEEVLAAALAEPEAWNLFVAGWTAFFDVDDYASLRLLMVDAPAAMGIEAWREIDDRYCLNAVVAGLRDLIDHGVIAPMPDPPLEALARVLLTAGNALAMHIATSADPAAERAALVPVFLRQLEFICPARVEAP